MVNRDQRDGEEAGAAAAGSSDQTGNAGSLDRGDVSHVMGYDDISDHYLQVRRSRLERIARKTRMTSRQIAEFEELEDKMNSGDTGADWLRSFHLSNDDYLRLLEKVLRAAVTLGEPHSKEKLSALIAEKGSMMPAVFLTPWDLTLAFLDREYGTFDDVERFYR